MLVDRGRQEGGRVLVDRGRWEEGECWWIGAGGRRESAGG